MRDRVLLHGRVLKALGLVGTLLVAAQCRDESELPTPPRAHQLSHYTAAAAVSCGAGCIVVANRQGLGVSLASDSIAPVHLADTRIAGRIGDSVWVRLAGPDSERLMLSAAQSLVVTAENSTMSIPVRALSALTLVHAFRATDTVSIRYDLGRAKTKHAAIRTLTLQQQLSRNGDLVSATVSYSGNAVAPPSMTCTAAAPGPSSCSADSVTIVPYQPGNPFGEFQSDVGTGASHPITITFSSPVRNVMITAADPTYAGNMVIAYDSVGNEIVRSNFAYSDTAGDYIESTRLLAVSQIKSIRLVPAAADYVAYSGLSFDPTDTCPPTGDPLLDSIATRTALSRAWRDSYADSTPSSVRKERGGFILRDTVTGAISAVTTYDTLATPCSNSPRPPNPLPTNTQIVANFHSHPFHHLDVTPTSCDKPNDPNTNAYDAVKYGGLSSDDWGYSTRSRIPVYAIDADSIYQGQPDVAERASAQRAAARHYVYGPTCR
jgi:hypothetical protein